MADDIGTDALEDGDLLDAVLRAREKVGCDEVGLIHAGAAGTTAVAHTGAIAEMLDRVQCEVGDGPSLSAIRQLQAMSVADVADLTWWPAFRRAALDGGVKSCLSVPLTDGSEVVGALGFYSRQGNALEGRKEIALDVADEAAWR
jgi:GAF domain-containing protein